MGEMTLEQKRAMALAAARQRAAEAQPSVLEDAVKAAPSAFARGTADLAGLPGTIADTFDNSAQWLLRKGYETVTGEEPSTKGGMVERFFAGPDQEVMRKLGYEDGVASNPLSGPKIKGYLSDATGGATDYQPKTTPGAFVRTGFEFLPSALATGGLGAGNLIKNAIVPALTSETAGQLTRDTWAEPYARIAAALLGGYAANKFGGSGVPVAPSAREIKAEGSAAYEAAKPALKDAKVSQEAYQKIVDALSDTANDFGNVPEVTGGVFNVVDRAAKVGGKEVMPGVLDPAAQPSLYDLEIMRRSLQNAGKDVTKPAAGELSGRLVDQLDEAVGGLGAGDLLAGGTDDAGKALETLTKARQTWATGAKASLIDRAMYRAQNAAGGYEAGLRNEFRSLLNDKKLMNTFTPAERQAMETVVRGTLGSNALRLLGTAGYPIDQGRNFLGAGAGAAVGSAIGSLFGPEAAIVGATVVPGLGSAAKVGARGMTNNYAEIAEAIVKAGPEVGAAYQSAVGARSLAARLAIARALMQGDSSRRLAVREAR